MEPSAVIDDAEFWLPPEFLTDEDFLVEKENNGGRIDEINKGFSISPYEKRHGFGDFGSNGDDDEKILAGLTRQMNQSSLEDDISGGFCCNQAFPAWNDDKAFDTLCVAGIRCGCRNQNRQSRAWNLYCDDVDEMAKMNINDGYNRGLLDLPRKYSVSSATKSPNNGHGYYNHHQSLSYQKIQAIQFQQLKQQQLLKYHRQLAQRSSGRVNSNNKNGDPVDLSSSAWSNQLIPRRDGSGMRAVLLGDQTGKRGSTGTGVFLPRRVNHTPRATVEISTTVLVPARVAQVLNLNLDEPVRSSASHNVWRQRSNNGGFSSQIHGGVRAEQPVNEPMLPPDWAY